MQPAAATASDYYTRLGLECDPFAHGAMPEFFFVGAQRRFLAQRAVHALYFSGAIVLLLGVDGAGKSHTLTEIEKELKDLTDICHIEATVLMDAAEIRAALAAALGLPRAAAADNAELVRALETVRPADGDPQPILIGVDAAQLLSIAALAECAALVAGAGGRLRLLLVGEPDLAISWQQAEAGAAEILELKLLDRSETEDYIRTKLQAAGYRGEQPLNADELDRLFAQSGGNFAAIDAIAPQLLQPQSEAVPVARRIKALPMLHIGIAAILLAIVIVLVLYRGESSPSPNELQSPRMTDNQPQQISSVKNGIEQSTVTLQLPASNAAAMASNTTLPSSSAGPASTLPASTEIASSVPAGSKNEPVKQTPAIPKNDSVATKETADKPVAAPHVDKQGRENTKTEKLTVENSSGKTVVNAASSSLDSDERALLAFPSSHYVLQLMGAESKTTVDKFAAGAGKGLKFYCYRTKLHGKPWFIVVAGPYADKNAAQTALNKLPDAVRKQQPWPRTLANVQADIRAHAGR